MSRSNDEHRNRRIAEGLAWILIVWLIGVVVLAGTIVVVGAAWKFAT